MLNSISEDVLMYDLFLAFMILVYVAYVISQIAQGKMVNDFSMQNY